MTKRTKAASRTRIIEWASGHLVAILGVVLGAFIVGGWQVHAFITEELADRTSVIVAGTKADFALDKLMEQTIARINQLEAKKAKTVDERDQIKYLRDELERMRQIRRGK